MITPPGKKTLLVRTSLAFVIISTLCRLSMAAPPIIDYYHEEESYVQIVSPELGHSQVQKNHFIVWETQCLVDPYTELATVSTEEGDKVDQGKSEGSVTNTLENFEKLFVNKKILEKIDIVPFLETIENKKAMGVTEYKNTAYLSFMIIMLTCVLGLIVTIVVFSCTRLSKKQFKMRPRCVKCCWIFLGVFVIVMFILLLVSIAWTPRMLGIQNDLLCEATRLPHTLFFGSPEIHYKVPAESKFLGFERIRKYLLNFLNSYQQFTRGLDADVLNDIKKIGVAEEVKVLFMMSEDFKEKYKNKKILNSEGEHGIPLSISHSMPLYLLYLNSLVETYDMTSTRVENINILSPMLQDPTLSKTFESDLKSAASELEELEVHLSTFWNDIMTGTFDSTVGFNVAVIGLLIICLVLWLAVAVSSCTLWKKTKSGKIRDRLKVRFLLGLVLFLMIFAFIAIFDVGRATFSTLYGCATLHQFKHDPENTKPLIQKHLLKDEAVLNVLEKCYFNPKISDSLNFYDLFKSQQSRSAIENYLTFLDAIKVFHEEANGIRPETDRFHTKAFEEKIVAYKDGLSYDFPDVFRNLSLLNYNFTCSDMYFALTDKTCVEMPDNKTHCVIILTGIFTQDPCMNTLLSEESESIFLKLQNHMKAEQIYADEMLDDLVGPNNSNSILNKIEVVLLEFGKVDANVKKLTTDLHSSFKDMAPGHLYNWLDCRAIRKDIDTSYDRLCGHYLFSLGQYGDVTFFILFFAFICIAMIFVMTCCFENRKEYSQARGTATELNRTQDFDDNNTDPDMMRQNTEEDAFGQFGTFKTQEPSQDVESRPGKENRVEDMGGENYRQFGESDDEDVFNDKSNEFDFKK